MSMHPVPDDDLEILAVAGLRLLGNGGGAAELAERFTHVQIPNEPVQAAALIAYLSRLGLVRVAATPHGKPQYVLTLLGQQYADTLAGGSHPMSAGLEELERLRTEFMATIAHELRTPLTAVRTCVSLLLESSGTLDPDIQVQLLENVARSADRMQRLVADLLDLVLFRAGQIRLQPRQFDACALAYDAGSTMVPIMEARDQILEITTPAEPVWMYADRRRLEQALLNLLSNAERFSRDGARIWLTLQADEERVVWSIIDTGPGIGPEDQTHLFERFYTHESDADVRRTGAGLGLPIALAIAQAHGGTITVDSAIGHGSTFALSIPRYADVEVDEE